MLDPVYQLNPETNIWQRPDYQSIAYSDGTEVETRLQLILQQTTDLSTLSPELRQHCTDWVTTYHLSSERANLLRPFAEQLQGDILEIGAGCGAITRYLGECGARVLALEGTAVRAQIARTRTAELDNVTVLAERFEEFCSPQKFDWVSLIGVLEYASLFSQAKNPHLALLKRAHSLLKPGGKLIIAIENQFGLKYFAGAPEDHLGKPMLGIEGQYEPTGVQTFGRKTLVDLISQAGFLRSEFLAPFPDYKLPVSIITDRGCTQPNFNASTLAWQSAHRDLQLPSELNFSLELAWPAIFNNHLAVELSNSFLIVATTDANPVIDPKILAYHFTTNRLPEYCKASVFIAEATGIKVKCQVLSEGPAAPVFQPARLSDYVWGELLSFRLWRILATDQWTLADIAQYFQQYLGYLHQLAGGESTHLPGHFIDAQAHNIVIQPDGTPVLIDCEWQQPEPVAYGYVVYRALNTIVAVLARRPSNHPQLKTTKWDVLNQLVKLAAVDVSEAQLQQYQLQEQALQQTIYGCAVTLTDCFPMLSPDENLIVERDALLAQVAALQASTSWRLTAPIRYIKRFI